MSEENVEVFRATYDAWNRSDFDAWFDNFDPEVRWSALLEEFRGLAGIRRAWRTWKVELQLKVRFDDIRDLGDSVLALGEVTGTGRITGLNLRAEIAQLASFRDGRILGFRDFASHAEALEAAGLSESAMSQENVEALEAVYARWGAGDFWTPDIFDPDVEVVWAGDMPDFTGPNRGLAALDRGIRNLLAVWDDYAWAADRFIPLQDRVLVLFTARGRGKGSHMEVEAHWAHLWTFREGKATRVEGFLDQVEALEAAGLSE